MMSFFLQFKDNELKGGNALEIHVSLSFGAYDRATGTYFTLHVYKQERVRTHYYRVYGEIFKV